MGGLLCVAGRSGVWVADWVRESRMLSQGCFVVLCSVQVLVACAGL